MIARRTIEAYRAPSGDGCAIGLAGFLRQRPFLEASVVFDADVHAQHEVAELNVERVGIVGYLGQAQAALARFELAYVGLGLAEFLGNGVLGHVCFATHGFEFNADGAIEIRIHTAGLYCPQGYIPKRDVKSYRARWLSESRSRDDGSGWAPVACSVVGGSGWNPAARSSG